MLKQIKRFVVSLSEKSVVGELFYYYLKYSTAKFLGLIWSEERYARWFYHLYTGKNLNLKNPAYFDEKVWWLKLNNRDPLLTICSDKQAVRDYVKGKGFVDILIPQVALYSSVKEIEFDKFEKEVVIKCTHNSGGHIFYNPFKPTDKSKLEIEKRRLNFILHRDASVLSKEWNYRNIKPQLMVEEVIRDKDGNLPLDYKFMCFNGEPRLLFLDLGLINADSSYNHHYPRNIYDMNFNLLKVRETRPNADFPVEKPIGFEKMIEIARELSSPFPFCRVDLYNVDGMIYFGEITFYHGGGCNDIQPIEWDRLMGDWIDISSPKIVLNSRKN